MKLEYPKVDINLYLSPTDNVEELLSIAEKHVIGLAIERCNRNQVQCAKALGVSRTFLRTRLKRYFGGKYFKYSPEIV